MLSQEDFDSKEDLIFQCGIVSEEIGLSQSEKEEPPRKSWCFKIGRWRTSGKTGYSSSGGGYIGFPKSEEVEPRRKNVLGKALLLLSGELRISCHIGSNL